MNALRPKPISASALEEQAHTLFPGDLNSHGTAFGGRVIEIADRLAATIARRHHGGLCVLLSMDTVRFLGRRTRAKC